MYNPNEISWKEALDAWQKYCDNLASMGSSFKDPELVIVAIWGILASLVIVIPFLMCLLTGK